MEFTAFATDDVNGDFQSRTTILLEGITDLPDEAFHVVLNGSNGNTYIGDENLLVNVGTPGQNTTVSNGTIVVGTAGNDAFNIINNTRLADHVVFGGEGDDTFTNTRPAASEFMPGTAMTPPTLPGHKAALFS